MQQLKHLSGVVYVETDAEGTILRLVGGSVSDTSAVGKNIETFLPGQVGITLALQGKSSRFRDERWGKRFTVHAAPVIEDGRVVGAIGLGVETPDEPELLGVSGIARVLHLSEDAVRKKLQRGVLPGLKVGGRWAMSPARLAEILPGGCPCPACPVREAGPRILA